MQTTATSPATFSVLQTREPGWIYKKGWDLSLLIFSALLVPLPLLLAELAERTGWLTRNQAIDIVNILVAGLIGGPHLYSTFTLTYLNRSFLRRHPIYAGASALLPAIVIYLGLYHYTVLIFMFFTWASIHVLHQIIYITDCYRVRAGFREPLWSRLLDYGVILTGLYPIGLYKLSQGQFRVAGVVLPYPDFLRPFPIPELAAVVFFSLLLAWVAKTAVEVWQDRVSYPKTLLIAVTATVSFFLPMASNMDVGFQGYNTWHSFQYMFLFWLINRLRYERGEVDNTLVQRLVRKPSMLPYYLFFVGVTGAVVLLVLLIRLVTPLTPDQSYFIVILSTLLIHYYFDHFLFTRTEYVV